jgi:hypothetical protein
MGCMLPFLKCTTLISPNPPYFIIIILVMYIPNMA